MRIKLIILGILLTMGILAFASATSKEHIAQYTENKALKTVATSPDFKGTPLDTKGRFTNLYHPFTGGLGQVFKWKFSKNEFKKAKKEDKRSMPYAKTAFNTATAEDYLIFLGHATFLFQLDGKTFITDPLLFDNFFLKRHSQEVIKPEALPSIDYLLLSHNHRDHCDKKSIQFLAERNPDMKVLTGLGMESVIGKWLKGQQVQEAGWFQQFNLVAEGIEVFYTPTRHWSKRSAADDNKSLWGGFFVKEKSKSIYFMGDSGMSPVFSDIKDALGSPTYALMGIGAFEPEWFMHQAHISPTDAIEAFNTLGAQYFIPMHYGTLDLSDEPLLHPWDVLSGKKSSIQGHLVEPILGQQLFRESVAVDKESARK
ncbi:MAG: MBL fold metallo-hydrolase [Luteibaculaceae bacterium]